MIVRSSAVKWDKSGLLGPIMWPPPEVDPVDELPGPNPELMEAANPESDMPPPELPTELPKALRVAARELITPTLLTTIPLDPMVDIEIMLPSGWPETDIRPPWGGGSPLAPPGAPPGAGPALPPSTMALAEDTAAGTDRLPALVVTDTPVCINILSQGVRSHDY